MVEHSTNLVDWSRWPVPGNDGLPRPPGALWSLEAPRQNSPEFLRATIRER